MKEPVKEADRRKICFLAVATHWGGAEKSLFELVMEVQRQGQLQLQGQGQGQGRPTLGWVLLPKEEGPLVDALRKEGLSYKVIPMPPSFLRISRSQPWRSLFLACVSLPGVLLYLIQVVRALREADPSVIHTTGLKCHYLSALMKPWVRAKVLWHLRDIYPPGLNRSCLRALGRWMKIQIIANSEATARAFGGGTQEIPVVYNGLDPEQYFPRPNARFRDLLQISSATPVIGLVGVFSRWKGQLEFIEMAKRLTAAGVDARFVLIGDSIYDTLTDGGVAGGFRKELEDRVRLLGLSERFHFTGFDQDVVGALNGLDILVHASLKPEPFGRVVLEAMACGIPVVAARDGGIPEFVEDRKTGVLYSPGNIEEMSLAVQELISHPDQRAALAREARNVFLKRFTAKSYAEGVMKICEAIAPSVNAGVLRSESQTKRRLIFAIHDLHPWGGQDQSTLEIIKRLQHFCLLEVYAFTVQGIDPIRASHQLRIHLVKPPIKRPVLLKSLIFQLSLLFSILGRRLFGQDLLVHATGTCSWVSDLVHVQFLHAAWEECSKKTLSPPGKRVKALYRAFELRFNVLLERVLYHNQKRYIALSRQVAQDLNRIFGINKDQIAIIYHGVDSQRFRPLPEEQKKMARKALRAELQLKEECLIFLFVGTPERKGLGPAMQALKLLKEGTPGSYALLAVGVSESSPYLALAREMGIAEELRCVPPTREVLKYYQASDVFLLPTLYEPFGLVGLEAMACGLPPVFSRCAGVAELTVSGQSALWI